MIGVVAECGVNWSTLNDALEMIRAAAKAQACAVKFQLFNEDVIKNSPLKDRLMPLILDEEKVKVLKGEADKLEIGFILTPMYLEAVDLAAKYADYIKIRFKDNENTALIDKALDTGKSMFISVPGPMIVTPERQWPYVARVKSMYCNPFYPPAPEDFNLDRAAVCPAFSSHFPHTTFDLAYAINRIHDEAYIEKHVMFNFAGSQDSDRQCTDCGTNVVCTGTGDGDGLIDFWVCPKCKAEFEAGGGTGEFHKVGANGFLPEDYHPTPIDAAVSLSFSELEKFIKQLQLIERMKRTRI